jgi:hypothetical protein
LRVSFPSRAELCVWEHRGNFENLLQESKNNEIIMPLKTERDIERRERKRRGSERHYISGSEKFYLWF